MQVSWGVEDDRELPRRSMTYLMKNGLTRSEAAEAVSKEFGLDEAARRVLFAA